MLKKYKTCRDLVVFVADIHSLLLGAGGFREAQFVLIARLPIHWPFIEEIAVSASCNGKQVMPLVSLCHFN